MNKEIDIQPCQMNSMAEYRHTLKELLSNKTFISIMSAYIILIVILLYFFLDRFDIPGTVIGLSPIIPVLGLFHINFRKQWEDKLPKFLNATYEYKEIKRLEIRGIPLQGITDVRAQAQSISVIFLNKNKYFSIKPMLIKTSEPSVVYDKSKKINKGKPFMLYKVTLHLLQDVVSDNTKEDEDFLAAEAFKHRDKLFKDKQAYLRLDPNFDLEKDLKIIDVKVKAESAEKLMN